MGVRQTLAARQTNERYTFQQWLGFIDHVFLTYGWRYRVAEKTGEECWLGYYEDGYTAEDAVLEDMRCGL